MSGPGESAEIGQIPIRRHRRLIRRRTMAKIKSIARTSGHVSSRETERLLSDIWPSPVNDTLYRPLSPSDPEVLELAESIRAFGLKEPIVVTADGYILSGHRRYLACRLAGLTRVRCRVEAVRSTDPNF